MIVRHNIYFISYNTLYTSSKTINLKRVWKKLYHENGISELNEDRYKCVREVKSQGDSIISSQLMFLRTENVFLLSKLIFHKFLRAWKEKIRHPESELSLAASRHFLQRLYMAGTCNLPVLASRPVQDTSSNVQFLSKTLQVASLTRIVTLVQSTWAKRN